MTENGEDDGFIFNLDRKSGVPRKKIKYTEQYSIDEIKRFSAANPNKQLTATNYELWPGRDGNRQSLRKAFGGWTQLMQAAEISNDRYSNRVITDEYCIEYFEYVWRWKKSQPSAEDLKVYGQEHPKITPISSYTYGRRWGGLPRFAKLFTKYKNKMITKSALINKKYKENKRVPISVSLRAKVLQRDNRTCQDCGKTVADGVKLEIHHIVPVSRNGPTIIENLTVNCEACNRGKSDKILD